MFVERDLPDKMEDGKSSAFQQIKQIKIRLAYNYYRPICLLNAWQKVLVKLLIQRVQYFLRHEDVFIRTISLHIRPINDRCHTESCRTLRQTHMSLDIRGAFNI